MSYLKYDTGEEVQLLIDPLLANLPFEYVLNTHDNFFRIPSSFASNHKTLSLPNFQQQALFTVGHEDELKSTISYILEKFKSN